VLLIEEAHRLLKNVREGPAAAAVELFASLLAEIRAYGEGVVIVEQIPSKILPDVIKNTAFKVMHRLPARDDRDAVGATMNLTDANSEAVVSFLPGIATVSVDGRPRLLVTVDGMPRDGATVMEPPMRGRRSLLCGKPTASRTPAVGTDRCASGVADDPVGRRLWRRRWWRVGAARPRRLIFRAWPASQRERDCALATLADRAVDARRTGLLPWVSPDDFAVRLRTILLAFVEERPIPPTQAGRWRAGAFRWQEMYKDLRSKERAAGEAPPHPRTQEWRSLGLDLDASTLSGQLAQLKNNPAYAHGNEHVLFGDLGTSGLQDALVELTAQPIGLRRIALRTGASHRPCSDQADEKLREYPSGSETQWLRPAPRPQMLRRRRRHRLHPPSRRTPRPWMQPTPMRTSATAPPLKMVTHLR
jgi:hypothetical protein